MLISIYNYNIFQPNMNQPDTDAEGIADEGGNGGGDSNTSISIVTGDRLARAKTAVRDGDRPYPSLKPADGQLPEGGSQHLRDSRQSPKKLEPSHSFVITHPNQPKSRAERQEIRQHLMRNFLRKERKRHTGTLGAMTT